MTKNKSKVCQGLANTIAIENTSNTLYHVHLRAH